MTHNTDLNLTPENLYSLFEKAPIGFLFFTSDWTIRLINQNFFDIGLFETNEASSFIGQNILESELPELLNIRAELEELQKNIFFEKEIGNVKTITGGQISIILKGASFFNEDDFSGGILILEDIKVVSDSRKDDIFNGDLIDSLVKDFSDIFFVTDNAFHVKYCFSSEMFNDKINASYLTGTRLDEVFNVAFDADISFILSRLKETAEKIESEIVLTTCGIQVVFQLKAVPYFAGKEKADFFLFFLKDASQGLNEEFHNKSEIAELKQYQFITSAVTDAVIATDMQGNINFWNKSSENLFQYSRSEVFGKFIGKVIKDFDNNYFKNIKEEINKNGYWESDLRIFNKAGNEEYLSLKISFTGDDDFRSVVFLCSSVTERIRIERELRISEERFRNIVINANEFICNLDIEGNIIYMNPSFIRAFEYSEGELLQRRIQDLFAPEFSGSNGFDIKNFTGFHLQAIEISCLTKSGRAMSILANFSPIVNFDNTIRYFNGIFTDITEKKKAEKELLTVRSVYEVSRDGISVEVGRKFILINNSFAKMFGYKKPSELLGKETLDIVADEDIPKVARYIKDRENKEQSPNRYDFVGKSRDGSRFFVEASVTSYESDNKVYTVRVCRDITERKHAQEALKDSEEKYRSITENIDDFLWTAEVVNGRLRPVFYTSSIEKVTGYEQERFLSRSNLWFRIIYPDDTGLFKKKLRNLVGDIARNSDEFEFRILNKPGNIVWVRNKVKVIRDKDNRTIKIYGLISDISLSKKAEEELKKSAVELRELNDTKDKFISIISHDLRTPFSSIMGFTEILLGQKNMSDAQRTQYIEFIQQSSQNMLALVNSLLDWTRLQTGRIKFEPQRFNATESISKSIAIVGGVALQKGIKLVSVVQPDLFIHADLNLLLQVVNNLLGNSIKFTPRDGQITIYGELNKQLNKVQFIIEDTGTGIRKENLSKLFKVDSKFTLEGTAGEKGSGLGLSIVHDIIEKHGGEIWVESEYGKGSKFFFTIPTASASILLVDDSRTDRLLYSKILKNIIPQYKIDEADNGREALEMILKNLPALVITDHHMPEMGGYDMVKSIKSGNLQTKPPVIVLSYDVSKNIMEEYRELGVEYVFQKPVILSSFKEAIEKSLKKALAQ
ncbi:MAG: PAS domain S-box protein [Ignavibacteria bacterium]